MSRAAALVLGVALVLGGCASGNATPDPAAPVADLFSGGYPTYRDPTSGITTILGTPDLAVGTFRVALALSDRDGLVRVPSVTVETYRVPRPGVPSDPSRWEGPVETRTATFTAFPADPRGLYATALTFDRAGTWALRVRVPRAEGAPGEPASVAIRFPVAKRALAPAAGDAVPASRNRTVRDVASLAMLTSSGRPDPALYQHSVAQALEARRPFVVVFASPAFCTNALCGPQVEEVGALASTYAGRANFVHIDIYERPDEIRGDLARARRSPLLKDWGLKTDEWTFVVGADGRVVARFEAFVPRAEVEAALRRGLDGP